MMSPVRLRVSVGAFLYFLFNDSSDVRANQIDDIEGRGRKRSCLVGRYRHWNCLEWVMGPTYVVSQVGRLLIENRIRDIPNAKMKWDFRLPPWSSRGLYPSGMLRGVGW